MRFLRSTAAIAAVAGALFSHNASAVNIANEGIGEVAISPFYTTRDGWQSTINLINTQDVPVAVKIRFHEGLNSRDVLDFTVLLSAFDVFTGVVREGAGGTPVFVNIDQANVNGLKTCTVPNTTDALNGGGEGIEVPLSRGGFAGPDSTGVDNADGGPETSDRLREGYIEFIVMGYADQDYGIDPSAALIVADPIDSGTYAGLSAAAKRNFIGRAIEDHDCPTLRTAFVPANIQNTARQFGEPISALKFNFTLLNPGRGTETGYSATTWSNFYNPGNGSGVVTPNGLLDDLVIPEDNFNCDLDRGIERRTARTGSAVVTGTNWCPDGLSDDGCATGGPAIDADTVNADYAVGVDFVNAGGAADDAAVIDSCRNLITAQFPDDFLEPTLNDAFPAVAVFIEDASGAPQVLTPYAPVYSNDLGTVEDVRGVDAVSLTIQRSAVINDWSTNPNLGVSTDWVVTQPTKAFYVDQSSAAQSQVIVAYELAAADSAIDADTAVGPADPNNGIKGRAEAFLPNTGPNIVGDYGDTGLVPYPPYAQKFAGVAPNARSCNQIGFAVYDRAEQSGEAAPDEPVFSPNVPDAAVPNQLCYEQNIISFVDSAGTLQTAVGTGLNRIVVDTPEILATPEDFGWMLMSVDQFGAGLFGSAMPYSATETLRGLPVIGFNIRTRNFPARPDLSFSSSADHAYLRTFFTP
ncbi:MAG: hypothetical protein M3O62_10195 [Pseudomonadota bacterium]|nr:hypothetical protein [Pseudomonadota bacterium]